MSSKLSRRKFLHSTALATTGSVLSSPSRLFPTAVAGVRGHANVIEVDPTPAFEISPYMYLQFMEPLGDTDGSVEAAWDYDTGDWRQDLVAATASLAPDVMRWGGNFIRYYKWREGVGPVRNRPSMYNYVWGGKETNRVGTHEFVDFCWRVGAEPLMCVNFLSDGRQRYWNTLHGENRRGDAREAADWVSYANDPDNEDRKRHGAREPYDIKLWQIGNETSYGDAGFSQDEAIAHTTEFARAMSARDPSVQLIGWGGRGRNGEFWAPEVLNRAGEHLDYVAMHMMGMGPQRADTVLEGFPYQNHPEQAWEELLELTDTVEERVRTMKEIVHDQASGAGIAITEGHVSFEPHNANPILQEWLSAAYHARTMNIYLRNGDAVKMCTGADFCGTRWTVNAIKMPVPRWDDKSFFLPVASVMRLFKIHNGTHGVTLNDAPSDLDVAASRSGNAIYLHVLNLNVRTPVEAIFSVDGMMVTGGRVYEIAPDDLREYVNRERPNVFAPVEKALPSGDVPTWQFPPASVSAVRLDVET